MVGWPALAGVFWRRDQSLVPLGLAASKLRAETTDAGLSVSEATKSAFDTAGLHYHGRRLVQHAKHGKVTLFGKRSPDASAIMPISQDDLWSGKLSDDLTRWIMHDGSEYVDLLLRPGDLDQVIRFVKRSMRDHDALLAWCRRHAPSVRD